MSQMRVIHVVDWHDGTTGPTGVPRLCHEYPADREPPLPEGAVRFTADEYRAGQAARNVAYAAWVAENPPRAQPPEDPEPTPDRIIKTLAVLTGRSEQEARDVWRAVEASDAEQTTRG